MRAMMEKGKTMSDKKTVLVLFGGMSSEHEVSCSSAASILRNIDRDRYNVRVIGITKKGAWIETAAPPEMIEDGTWINRINNRNAYICPDRRVHGIRTEKGKDIRIDCVFSVLHGKYGEDGAMQGLLELAGIPYAGSGVLSSACTMDKVVSKVLANEGGIRQAEYCVLDWFTFATQAAQELQRVEETLGAYPYFVKPANTGSSVGVAKVRDRNELFEGIKEAAKYDDKILVEETIVGRELEVAVLGDRHPHASPVGEIVAADEFYSYEAKYGGMGSVAEVAENLSEEVADRIRETAIEVYKLLGCSGYSRVDFFLKGEDEIYFNEINSLPGFTSISMYPKLWDAAGVPYSELITRLIENAMDEDNNN